MDWTLEFAVSLLEPAAGGRVEGLASTHEDPFEAVRALVAETEYDRIIIATVMPTRSLKWPWRDLPRRVESLGIPVDVIRPERETLIDVFGPPMMSGCELLVKARAR